MPNVGSIFRVDAQQDRVRYFWCVGTDRTQLNSALIVVFRRLHEATAQPNLEEIIAGDIDFYCHVFLLAGRKQRLWHKVGFRRVDRAFPMLFRDSADYGDPSVRVSERWSVWKPNEPFRTVGRLTGDLRHAEIGVVVPPDSVVERIRTGKYGMQYPTYDQALEPCA
jgi:hypothetical protein